MTSITRITKTILLSAVLIGVIFASINLLQTPPLLKQGDNVRHLTQSWSIFAAGQTPGIPGPPGPTGPVGPTGATGNGFNVYTKSAGPNCANGGIREVDTFNGIESTDPSHTHYVCKGDKGDQGNTGPPGPPQQITFYTVSTVSGPIPPSNGVVSGTSGLITANCNAGDKVTGGGFTIPPRTQDIATTQDNSVGPGSWGVELANDDPFNAEPPVTVTANCVHIGP
jgi:hypothetical protein